MFMSPAVYIIAGPNGAGKTTFAREFLPQYAECKNFINADLIAQGMSPFSPEAAAFQAGRLMLAEIQRLAKRRMDFGFETTLSGMAHLNLIRTLRTDGYAIHILYLWLPRVELALSRIKGRVLQGGHDVPSNVVRRRFNRSNENFLRRYAALADTWTLFDNSGAAPLIIALQDRSGIHVLNVSVYNRLLERYPAS